MSPVREYFMWATTAGRGFRLLRPQSPVARYPKLWTIPASFSRSLVMILLLLSAPVQAGFYIDLGLLASTNRYDHLGSNPLFQVRGGYEWRLTESQSLLMELEHHCALLQGSPFNTDDDHRQNNSIGLFWRYTWK